MARLLRGQTRCEENSACVHKIGVGPEEFACLLGAGEKND